MCQKRTDSQYPLSGAWANVQGHATAQLQLSNQSPEMCQLGIPVMKASVRAREAPKRSSGAATNSHADLSGARELLEPGARVPVEAAETHEGSSPPGPSLRDGHYLAVQGPQASI